MEFGGWVFMAFSWVVIFSLGVFCFSRIFRGGLGNEPKKAGKRK